MKINENNIVLSPRLKLLWEQSYIEEGYKTKDIPSTDSRKVIALYPRSFIDEIQKIDSFKRCDFNFRGALHIDKMTRINRQWIIEFAKKHFTSSSVFQATDKNSRKGKHLFSEVMHEKLGDYDYTFKKKGFVPKEVAVYKRNYFDKDYFEILCQSKFTLCPAGDAPWSMRFYEAIISKSIPILENEQHAGRNSLEYNIGYKYLLKNDTMKYREDWTQKNYEKFLEHQTLLST